VKKIRQNQSGLAHLALIILVVVVLGVIGFVGYTVMNKNKKTTPSLAGTALTKAAKDDCEKKNDKNICKFFTSWKASTKYRMTATDPSGAKSVYEADGNKSHIVTTGETSFEVITIDKTTYTKAGSVWYKQTIKQPDQDVASNYKEDFKEPADDSSAKPTEDKTVYKSLGKEACGKLTCFKYEIVDPSAADEKQYIWFDDKDFQLRRSRTENKDGVSEQTFEYSNVTINTPSPVKELGPNQYIMPGQSEPATLPSAADLNADQ
jgi:outer membrane lipoprotein-sorting protein